MSRFLIEASLSANTLSKYKSSVKRFLTWCDTNRYDPSTMEQLDEILTEYFHCMYEENDGTGKGLAATTLYGLIKFLPRCENNLPTAKMSITGWLKLRPSKSYPPLTWDLTVLISIKMVQNGHLRFSIATLLAFDCFLRVGELVNLRNIDVSDVGDTRMGSEYAGTSLRLRQTKTGPNQWVQVENVEVVQLLRCVTNVTSGSTSRLFPFTAAQYRSVFKQTCVQLGLSHKYVPHSLRHGGATRWHLLGHSIEDVLLRGRWASIKSARRYIQAGRALLLVTSVSGPTASKAKLFAQHLLVSISLSLPQTH
jgi:site-specific recombinase XerC